MPRGVWTTSGWNWMPYRLREASTRPAYGVESVWAVGLKPAGSREIESRVAHPDRLLAVEAGEQRIVGGDADVGRAVFAVIERDDVAAELVGHQLGAVADAQDRDLAGPDGRIGARGALVVDRVRAAREDDRAGPAALEFGVRRVVRQELAVDVELADAPGDELGELAAEVEDDDGLAILGIGGGRAGRPGSGPGRRRSARSRGRPRPRRRPGRGPDGRRWRPHRGRSCRASVRPWMTRRCPPMPPSARVSPASRQCTGRRGPRTRRGPRSVAVAHRLGGHRDVALEFRGDVRRRRPARRWRPACGRASGRVRAGRSRTGRGASGAVGWPRSSS